MIDLNKRQRRALYEAIKSDFDYGRLQTLLNLQLDKRLDLIVGNIAFDNVAFEVVRAAGMERWRDELIVALRDARPSNPGLLRLSQELGLSLTSEEQELGDDNLQALINANDGFVDLNTWRSRLGELEGRVCRIEIEIPGQQDPGFGTGFLVGSDVVLTNHHVLEKVIDGTVERDKVTFRFDYKRLGVAVVNEGTTFGLKGPNREDWLLDHSEPSQADRTGVGKPGPEELDYALVRLSEAAAEGYVGGADDADPDTPERGFIQIPAEPTLPPAGSALLMVQHPSGHPLKLGVGKSKGPDEPADPQRLRYDTNAKKGSSGSPCFDIRLNLVALHHAGDPNFHEIFNLSFNQGVPIAKVRDLIHERERHGRLGK